ncbi:MAG TPA: uroporphyrinogen decarboxylase family protein [Candidatus Brocadiia bacterium]|nr:uroporphyrinogen decarboxylase family protein [Candidatus Brocadiia bacterium]
MNSRERVTLQLRHQETDRIPKTDSPWGTTIERWRKEGLPADKGPGEFFGYEFCGAGADNSFRLPTETIEDTPEYTITRNGNGAVMKNWKGKTSTPELIEHTIKDRAGFDLYKDHLEWDASRIPGQEHLDNYNKQRERGMFCHYAAAVGYDYSSSTCGPDNLLIAMAEDPGWVADLFDRIAELTILNAGEMMNRGWVFDGAFLYDDMGYKNATFFSPAVYRRLLFPSHKKMCDFFHSHKLPVILHSCGRVTQFLPYLIDAGFDCLQPLEVKAGMDLLDLKKRYGDRMAYMGGIDVRVMARGNDEEMRREIGEKIAAAKIGGGYIYHSDHSVPDNVSFESYRKVMELVDKYGAY